LQHPSPSKYSNTGKYGSKFVTVVVSGDPSIAEGNNNNIGLAAYQVSNQAMAMAQAGIIQPTVDHALMRVVKDENRIIPDVLYRYQNEYGTDVTQAAKPTFPVEYLLVNVGHGFPNEQTPALLNTSIPFPIENRVTEVATTEHVFKYIWNARDNLAYALSDFHVLLALAKTGILHLEVEKGRGKKKLFFFFFLNKLPSCRGTLRCSWRPCARAIRPSSWWPRRPRPGSLSSR